MNNAAALETTTPAERKVFDTLVRADLWLTAEELAVLTGLALRGVQDALYLLCDGEAIAEADGAYRAC